MNYDALLVEIVVFIILSSVFCNILFNMYLLLIKYFNNNNYH